MRTIRGRVLLKESGIGIPELTVVAYDAPRGVAAEPPAFEKWRRIAGVLTRADGAFEIIQEDVSPDRERSAAVLDLVVVVCAPDDLTLDPKARILFQSDVRRAAAGAIEEIVVRIPGADLDRVGVPHPTVVEGAGEDPKRVVARLVAAADRDAVLLDGGRLTGVPHVERARKLDAAFSDGLRGTLRDRLSAVPAHLADADTFVKPAESVEAKNAVAIKKGILEWINGRGRRKRAVMKRHVALTDAQLTALRGMLAPDGTIDAAALADILGTPSTTHLRALDPCRSASEAERACADALGVPLPPAAAGAPATPPAPTPPAHPPAAPEAPANGVDPAADRVRQFVARLVDTMTTPEERLVTELEPRADSAGVESNIRKLSLAPSPADTPAFHDFHSLQIAFEDVWHELVDEHVVDLAGAVFAETMELGGDPARPRAAGEDPYRVLVKEADLAVRTHATARRARVTDHRDGPTVRDHRGGSRLPWVPQPNPGPADRPPVGPVRDHRSDDPLERVPGLLAELNRRLKEPYSFTVFAANKKERAVNFGILVGYRQIWTPLAYQAGKLAKTITLAPKESRKYSKKVVVRHKRAEKEARTQTRSVKEESEITSRMEQEILRKATAKTNFKLVSEGSTNVGVGEAASAGSAKTTTSFEREVGKSSEETKRSFHEAVFKAAQELKDEVTTQVDTEESSEDETIDSGEITNPNDELAVTFLFYELQRRYRVSEKLHKVTPVVLVAQEMPRPDEIDEDWILAHDWIIRKVLLDDSFRPALDYLAQHVAGDEIGLRELGKNVEQQRAIVDELRQEVSVVRDRILAQRELSERSLFGAAVKKKSGGSHFSIPIVGGVVDAIADHAEGLVREIGEFIHGPSTGDTRGNPLEDAIQRSVDQERELVMQLERETTALNALTERFAKGVADHRNRQVEIARMLVHVKANILHYMQAIWSFEPADQRYFRLHKVRVPTFKPERTTVRFPSLAPRPDSMARLAHRRLGLDLPEATDLFECDVVTEIDPEIDYVDLAIAADLDELLGFKGNYMIFPLRESNPVTDLQMAPYVVAGWNEIVDPDDIGNWTLDEFVRYVNCLKATLPEADFAAVQEQLRAQYRRLLSEPRRDGEVLTLPTSSLFIEALPATQTLMEEFKRRHRGVDVKRAQAEVRRIELENLRYAMRVLKDELDDPDVEKHVVVAGMNGSSILVPPADA